MNITHPNNYNEHKLGKARTTIITGSDVTFLLITRWG